MDTIKKLWRQLLKRLSDAAERLSAWLHPGWRIAPLTTGRVVRFHDFLREAGFEAAYDGLSSGADAGAAPSGLSELADQMQAGADQDVAPEKAKEVASRLRRKLIDDGQLVELNQILFDVSEREARKIPTDVVEVCFANFLVGWLRHLTRLMGTASGTTSQPANQ